MRRNFSNLNFWLAEKLEERGMSAETLANRVGVTRTTIYNYMRNAHRPREGTMRRICMALGVPPEEGLQQYSHVKALPKPRKA